MAGLVHPLGILGNEWSIADLLPVADAGGEAVELHARRPLAIVGTALT